MPKLVKTISQEESKKLLEELLNKSGTSAQRRNGIRNYLMGLLMIDAGLRVGELVQLKQGDLMFSGQPILNLLVSRKIAKRHVERTIPMSQRCQDAIKMMSKKIWTQFNEAYSDLDYAKSIDCLKFAFYQHRYGLALGSRQVRNIIEDASIKALGYRIHPHVLRHTFATRLMRTTNIRIVQQLLGHVRLSSTQVYTHPDSQDLKKAIANLD